MKPLIPLDSRLDALNDCETCKGLGYIYRGKWGIDGCPECYAKFKAQMEAERMAEKENDEAQMSREVQAQAEALIRVAAGGINREAMRQKVDLGLADLGITDGTYMANVYGTAIYQVLYNVGMQDIGVATFIANQISACVRTALMEASMKVGRASVEKEAADKAEAEKEAAASEGAK